MPFGIQPIHLIVIAIAALLIFGPARLPEIGRSIGRGLNEFRRGAKEMTENFSEEINRPETSVTPPTIAPPTGSRSINPSAEPVLSHAAEPAAEMITCPACETANPAQARFCNNCGAKLA